MLGCLSLSGVSSGLPFIGNTYTSKNGKLVCFTQLHCEIDVHNFQPKSRCEMPSHPRRSKPFLVQFYCNNFFGDLGFLELDVHFWYELVTCC